MRTKEAEPMNNSCRAASGYSFWKSHAFLDSIILSKYCKTSEVRAISWFDDAVRDLLYVSKVLLAPGVAWCEGWKILARTTKSPTFATGLSTIEFLSYSR